MMRTFLLILFALSTEHINAQTELQTDTGWSTFKGKNFRISYPDSWTIDTSHMMGAELFIFSPIEKEEDHFNENINVIIQDLKGMDMDLQKYLELSEKQILEYANDGEIYLSTVDKNAGYGVIRYKMKQGKKLLNITSRFKIKFEKVYLITFCSLLDEYREFEQLSNKILASFCIE